MSGFQAIWAPMMAERLFSWSFPPRKVILSTAWSARLRASPGALLRSASLAPTHHGAGGSSGAMEDTDSTEVMQDPAMVIARCCNPASAQR